MPENTGHEERHHHHTPGSPSRTPRLRLTQHPPQPGRTLCLQQGGLGPQPRATPRFVLNELADLGLPTGCLGRSPGTGTLTRCVGRFPCAPLGHHSLPPGTDICFRQSDKQDAHVLPHLNQNLTSRVPQRGIHRPARAWGLTNPPQPMH